MAEPQTIAESLTEQQRELLVEMSAHRADATSHIEDVDHLRAIGLLEQRPDRKLTLTDLGEQVVEIVGRKPR